jgi:hypothetical protein
MKSAYVNLPVRLRVGRFLNLELLSVTVANEELLERLRLNSQPDSDYCQGIDVPQHISLYQPKKMKPANVLAERLQITFVKKSIVLPVRSSQVVMQC